ncbi:MAG: carbohydrate ABC transporter permease [Lachnospiraceae bacterium]|jgi:putative aldouronate transport system permease protein|nr:carbohydrate ABC transporter permease [Lachnospiraceae bacterium]
MLKSKKRFKRTVGELLFDLFKVLFILFISIVCIYPFWNIFVISVNDGQDALRGGLYFWPRMFTLENYEQIFQRKEFLHAILVTLSRTLIGTPLVVLNTSMLAYVLSREKLIGRKFWTLLFIFTMYFSGGMVPYYLQLKNLGLLDKFVVYIFPTMLNVYYMILIRSYLYGIPESLVESAQLDGANDLKIYARIIFPLAKPVIMTIVLFASISHWNAWFDSRLYTNSMDLKTLQLVLVEILNQFQTSGTNGASLAQKAQLMSGVTQKSVQMAAVMVATIPIICVYPFVQKYFVKGIMIGAVKA